MSALSLISRIREGDEPSVLIRERVGSRDEQIGRGPEPIGRLTIDGPLADEAGDLPGQLDRRVTRRRRVLLIERLGASSARGASAKCVGSGFTGGGVALAQYPSGGFDADLRCT